MRYWDSSALVHLAVKQAAPYDVRPLLAEDDDLTTCWLTRVECWSALARLRRRGGLSDEGERDALRRLDAVYADVSEVLLTEPLRGLAGRLLRTHELRAGDAVQLAAALLWAQHVGDPVLVSLDRRLAQAATLEGLRVLP